MIKYLVIAVLFLSSPAFAVFSPPVGIPDPSDYFGVFDPIDAIVPDSSTMCSSWPSAQDSSCYYIDNSVSCTDSLNTYGYPANPRCTIPINPTLIAGDYMEIQGGGAAYTGSFRPRGVGTAASPIWIVGKNTAVLDINIDIGYNNTAEAAYMVFDSVNISKATASGNGISIRPRYDNNTVHHIVIRNANIVGSTVNALDGGAISVGADEATQSTRPVTDIVLYNLNIYNWGNPTDPNEECGVYPDSHLTRLWVLDSDIHDNAEDGLAGSHSGERTSTYYYIGRNNIYDNVTNAIDIKGYGTGVIISENDMYGHHAGAYSSGDGESIVIHYSGDSTGNSYWNNFPEDVSVLFNTIHDSDRGVVTSDAQDVRIIGNVFYGINHLPAGAFNPATAYAHSAINVRGIKGDVWIVNNTIYDSDGGILTPENPAVYNAGSLYYKAYSVSYNSETYVCIDDNAGAGITGIAPSNATYWKPVRVQILGNIITERTEELGRDIFIQYSTFGDNSVDMDYNLTYESTWGECIGYGSSTIIDLAGLQSASDHCDNCKNTDPLLVNPTTDFSIASSSPAKDASLEELASSSAYDDFLDTFSINIQVDKASASRPLSTLWDIGAYEYNEATAPHSRGTVLLGQ